MIELDGVIAAATGIQVVVIALAYALGYRNGQARGEAEQWQKDFFERIEAERNRRGPDGKFCAKTNLTGGVATAHPIKNGSRGTEAP